MNRRMVKSEAHPRLELLVHGTRQTGQNRRELKSLSRKPLNQNPTWDPFYLQLDGFYLPAKL